MKREQPDWAKYVTLQHVMTAVEAIREEPQPLVLIRKQTSLFEMMGAEDISPNTIAFWRVAPAEVIAWGLERLEARVVDSIYFNMVEDVAFAGLRFIRHGCHGRDLDVLGKIAVEVMNHAMARVEAQGREMTLGDFMRGGRHERG